jgi:hypothetical protein
MAARERKETRPLVMQHSQKASKKKVITFLDTRIAKR